MGCPAALRWVSSFKNQLLEEAANSAAFVSPAVAHLHKQRLLTGLLGSDDTGIGGT